MMRPRKPAAPGGDLAAPAAAVPGAARVGPAMPGVSSRVPPAKAPSALTSATLTQQRMAANPRLPPVDAARVKGTADRELVDLKRQVMSLSTTVQNWHQCLSEMTEAVFVVTATAQVDGLPFYTELPTTRAALKAPDGRLRIDQRVCLLYPQFPLTELLFMRYRWCDADTGEIVQYYVPVANRSLPPHDLYEVTGVNTEATRFFGNFHCPGTDVA